MGGFFHAADGKAEGDFSRSLHIAYSYFLWYDTHRGITISYPIIRNAVQTERFLRMRIGFRIIQREQVLDGSMKHPLLFSFSCISVNRKASFQVGAFLFCPDILGGPAGMHKFAAETGRHAGPSGERERPERMPEISAGSLPDGTAARRFR